MASLKPILFITIGVFSVVTITVTIHSLLDTTTKFSNDAIVDYQFRTSLRLKSENEHFCSGSIIENNWFLTSARCVIARKSDQLSVVYGNAAGKMVDISQIFIHPNYSSQFMENDIALLRTRTEIVARPFGLPMRPVNDDEFSIVSDWSDEDVSFYAMA